MVNRYLRLLVAINLVLASCGSPKNLGPSFGGGGELPEQATESEPIHPVAEFQNKTQSLTLESIGKADVELSSFHNKQNSVQKFKAKQPNIAQETSPVRVQDTILPQEQSLPEAPKKVKNGSGLFNTGMMVFGLSRFAYKYGNKTKLSGSLALLGLAMAVWGLIKRKNSPTAAPISHQADSTEKKPGMSETEKKTLIWAILVTSLLVNAAVMGFIDLLLITDANDPFFSPLPLIFAIAGLLSGVVFMINLKKSNMEFEEKRKALLEEDN
jgi:hypothetical protein